MTLFNTISPYLSTGAISGINQFLLTLMRLRLNLGTEDLACRFGVSNSTTSRVFRQVIDIIHARLVPVLLFWPEREVLQQTMPMCFRNSFRKCTSIIDCFEILFRGLLISKLEHRHIITISPTILSNTWFLLPLKGKYLLFQKDGVGVLVTRR